VKRFLFTVMFCSLMCFFAARGGAEQTGQAAADDTESAKVKGAVSNNIAFAKRDLRSATIRALDRQSDAGVELLRLAEKLNRLAAPAPRPVKREKREESGAQASVERTTAEGTTTQPAAKAGAVAQRSEEQPLKLDAGAIGDPVAGMLLANSLYRAGHYEEALSVYERVQELGVESDLGLWVLLQKAACMDACSEAGAQEAYREVLRQGGDYVWGEIAAVRAKVANWKTKEGAKKKAEKAVTGTVGGNIE